VAAEWTSTLKTKYQMENNTDNSGGNKQENGRNDLFPSLIPNF
jgi:hypothetical protein